MTKEKTGAATMAELLQNTGYKIPNFNYGDIVEGKVVSLSRSEILLDVGAKAEGLIAGRELEEQPHLWKTLQVGDKLAAFVVQAENDQGYLVLSLRRAAPDKRFKELEDLYDKDETLSVRVTDYTKGGLLVDAGGISGFVPLSHLSRSNSAKIQKGHGELAEKARTLVGETLTVKVIEMDKLANRLVLSEKEVVSEQGKEARTAFLEGLTPGRVLEGRVSGVMPFGLFVEIGPATAGLEGMVHLSEVAWEKVTRAGDYHKVGDKVKVKVLEVDPGLAKIALSIKQTLPNPWEKAAEKYKVGSVVEGQVAKIVAFGAFVRLEKGLDGLIHVTETTGPLKVGEKVKAMVLDVNPREQRLALSLKKMLTDHLASPGPSEHQSQSRAAGEGSNHLVTTPAEKKPKSPNSP